MKLENFTNLPNDWVRSIIRSVKPACVKNFDVMLKNGKKARGGAYYEGSGFHSEENPDKPFIVICLGKPKKQTASFPIEGRNYSIKLGSKQEIFVFVLAHELRHLWQKKVKKGHRVWGARGRYSEVDADAFATQALRTFRRGEI